MARLRDALKKAKHARQKQEEEERQRNEAERRQIEAERRREFEIQRRAEQARKKEEERERQEAARELSLLMKNSGLDELLSEAKREGFIVHGEGNRWLVGRIEVHRYPKERRVPIGKATGGIGGPLEEYVYRTEHVIETVKLVKGAEVVVDSQQGKIIISSTAGGSHTFSAGHGYMDLLDCFAEMLERGLAEDLTDNGSVFRSRYEISRQSRKRREIFGFPLE